MSQARTLCVITSTNAQLGTVAVQPHLLPEVVEGSVIRIQNRNGTTWPVRLLSNVWEELAKLPTSSEREPVLFAYGRHD